jgi:hypothetical protein
VRSQPKEIIKEDKMKSSLSALKEKMEDRKEKSSDNQ